MKKLSVLFVVFAALLGCTAQVSDQRDVTGDEGSLDPQIVPGPVDVELTVTNGEPGLPGITPEAGNVELGAQAALFLEFTLSAKSHLLTVEHTRLMIESPVGGSLVDIDDGTPYFTDYALGVSAVAKVLHPTVTVTPAAIILDFEDGIRVVPGDPTVASLYLTVANPAPPEDWALLYKGYVARLVPIEEGDVTDHGPSPWSPPLDDNILPLDQIEQENIQGGAQTPVPPSP